MLQTRLIAHLGRRGITTAAAATAISAGKLAREPVDGRDLLPLGESVADTAALGYRLQAATLKKVLESNTQQIAGWKAGATNKAGRQRLGLLEPFRGPLFRDDLLFLPDDQEAMCTTTMAFGCQLMGVECEWAYRVTDKVAFEQLGATKPAHLTVQQQLELVEAAAGEALPSIEVVGYRLEGLPFAEIPTWLKIGDFASNIGAVLGPTAVPTPKLHAAIQAAGTSGVPSECFVDGTCTGRGSTRDVDGGPGRSVAWLARELASRRMEVTEGQVLLTGTMTGISAVKPGQRVRGSFGVEGIPEVEFQLAKPHPEYDGDVGWALAEAGAATVLF